MSNRQRATEQNSDADSAKEGTMSIFAHTRAATRRRRKRRCRFRSIWTCAAGDPTAYASVAERMLMAIGEPNWSTRGLITACHASSPTR